MLGIAPGTVTAHLARAIAALRHDLMPVLPQETFIMNDDTLLTAVRETFASCPHGHAARADRAPRPRRARLPPTSRVAGAVAVAAGTAVAVTALLPASHQPGAHLAA